MNPIRRARLLLDVAAAVAALTLASCSSPTQPVEAPSRSVVIEVDSEAEPSRVTLFAAVRSGSCVGWECPSPPYVADRLDVLQSTTGAENGYRRIATKRRTSGAVFEIEGLENDRTHWFRLSAYDARGRIVATSNPIMTSPGPIVTPSASIPLRISSAFDWSPDSRSIVYASASAPPSGRLTRFDVATGQVVTLTQPTDAQGYVFEVGSKRDGSSIAFSYTANLHVQRFDSRIWVRSSQDGSFRSITSGATDRFPAWGGDRWIYFLREGELPHHRELWRVDPDVAGSESRIPTGPAMYRNAIDVRPSDDLIVDCSHNEFWEALYTVDPASGAFAWLTDGRGWQDGHASWAPDGRSVVFVSTRSGHREVWSIDVATKAATQITRSPRDAWFLWPRWSPDGTRLGVIRTGPSSYLLEILTPAIP